MEGFEWFRHIDSHFASKQILKGFERSNHKRVKSIMWFLSYERSIMTGCITSSKMVWSNPHENSTCHSPAGRNYLQDQLTKGWTALGRGWKLKLFPNQDQGRFCEFKFSDFSSSFWSALLLHPQGSNKTNKNETVIDS